MRAEVKHLFQVGEREAAAAKLQGVDYYRWSFANEPEWEPYRGPASC